MENKHNAKVGKTYLPVVNQITVNSMRMSSQDISTWRMAVDSARSVIMPRRRLLYEMYNSITLDGHIASVMNKRKSCITNKKIMWVEKDGKPNDKIAKLITETPWFYNLLGYAAEAKAYGHSLIELITEGGVIARVELINRLNVIPEKDFVSFNFSSLDNGINYATDPLYNTYLISVGGKTDYGLLMSAAQYVIYKRGGFGDWAQFAEIFGMPFRVGKYDTYDDSTRVKLDTALNAMGGAGFAVIPQGTEIEFHQTNGSAQSGVFKDLIEMCNSEMSKLFLGQTMTTDNGSSRSQSETHQEQQDEIILSDMIEIEYMLNWQLKPKLEALGYPVSNGVFKFPALKQIPLDKLIDIATKINAITPIDEDYFYETFNVPKPKVMPVKTDSALPEPPTTQETTNEEPTTEPKSKLSKKKNNDYCCSISNYINLTQLKKGNVDELTQQERALITKMYAGDTVKYDYDTLFANTDKLKKAIYESLNTTIEYDNEDYLCATMMELNIFKFGSDKNFAQTQLLNEYLKGSKTYSEFEQKAADLLDTFNRAYLKTEYDHAQAVSQNAARWYRQKQLSTDYPYLRYETIGDNRVREAHSMLNGKVFSIDDTSWRDLYPPNGWGCRCEMIPVKKDGIKQDNVVSGTDMKKSLGGAYGVIKADGFAVNWGETKQVFELNKAYASKTKGTNIEFNNLNYKDAQLADYASMKGLPKLKYDTTATETTVLAQFDKQSKPFKNTTINEIKDYTGRTLLMKREVVEKHLQGKYVSEKRSELYQLIESVLNSPDEVYLNTNVRSGKYQYRYIKFYKENYLIVDVDINELEGMQINTWYINKDQEEQLRKGILIKRK
jgi:SPP1 gp7 family putative phage head morphogenesis protein